MDYCQQSNNKQLELDPPPLLFSEKSNIGNKEKSFKSQIEMIVLLQELTKHHPIIVFTNINERC